MRSTGRDIEFAVAERFSTFLSEVGECRPDDPTEEPEVVMAMDLQAANTGSRPRTIFDTLTRFFGLVLVLVFAYWHSEAFASGRWMTFPLVAMAISRSLSRADPIDHCHPVPGRVWISIRLRIVPSGARVSRDSGTTGE